MTDLDDIRDMHSQLLAGWNEHIEYAVIVNGNTERRAKSIRHPALIAELQAAARTTLVSQGTDTNGRVAAKPASRPPLNLAPLALIEDIKREALDIHDNCVYELTGELPPLNNRTLPAIMHNTLPLLARLQHHKPAHVHRAHAATRGWVRRARLMLGHDTRMTILRDKVCGECDGRLAVAADASTDVRCIGNPQGAGCGVVYERQHWAAMLDSGRGAALLLSTEAAVERLRADTVKPLSEAFWKRWLASEARRGRLTNHGGSGRGQALWSWEEVERAAY